VQLKKYSSYWCVPDCNEFVTDTESSVSLGSTTVHDLGDVDAIIPGNVLVADATGDAEAQTFGSLDQFDLEDAGSSGWGAPPHQLQSHTLIRMIDTKEDGMNNEQRYYYYTNFIDIV